jgi:hypothetical protein
MRLFLHIDYTHFYGKSRNERILCVFRARFI